jgi:hypothetical protein
MIFPTKFRVVLWPLCAALAACGSTEHSGRGPAGSGGSGAGSAAGEGGRPTHATGGSAASSGAGRSAASGGTGGDAGTSGSTAGGAASGHAGQGTGGQAATAGAAGTRNTGGAGTAGQAGENAAGGNPDEGIPGSGAFTKFTIRDLFAIVPTDDGYCTSGSPDENVWSFERASRTLTWDYCKAPKEYDSKVGTHEQGSRVLTDAEVQAVMNTLAFVVPDEPSGCRSDATTPELELEVDGTTTSYFEDYCPSGATDKNYIKGLGPLEFWVEWLSGGELPAMPQKLELYTGEVPAPQDHDCFSPPLPLDYELDLATGLLTWSWCELDPATNDRREPWPSDSRTLESAELDAVRRTYAALEVGVSGPCESIPKPDAMVLSFQHLANITIDDDRVVVDQADSCYGGSERQGGWAIGVPELTLLAVGGQTP